jgi:hypothetical protein
LFLSDVIEVPQDILDSAEEKHVQFGCDPSKNAYDDCAMPNIKPRELDIRFAGGHMHFGEYGIADDPQRAPRIVKALDAIWGVASVSLFEGLESPLRRIYYGRAGEYRLPRHGLEYRTPSNAWMCHPAIAQLSWTLARQAYRIGHGNLLSTIWSADETEVRRIINELDVKGARAILQQNCRVLEQLLDGYFEGNPSRIEYGVYLKLRPLAIAQGLRVLMEGAVTVLETPKDLVRNWMLDADTDTDRWYKPANEEARKKDDVWHLHTETGNSQWLVAAGTIEEGLRI